MIKQRALELYWTLTRLVGLQSLHQPNALRRALIDRVGSRFRRPRSQYQSFYRTLPKATALRLSESAATYGRSHDQAALKEIIETLARHGDYSQAARWCSKVGDMSVLSRACLRQIRDHTPTPFLRIGRGDYAYPLWKNFDIGFSVLKTTAEITLPIRSSSCALVYIENTFELEQSINLNRLIAEAARAVVSDGVVVLGANANAKAYFTSSGLSVLSDDTEQIVSRYDFIPRLASGERHRVLAAALKERV